MAYVSSLERIGIEKGIQQVTQQRMELAILHGQSRLFRILLEHRFGTLPAWVLDKISHAIEHDLDCWIEGLLYESSLEAIFNVN